MKYQQPSFSVPASGKAPAECKHGWVGPHGKCVLCGDRIRAAQPREEKPNPYVDGWRPSKMFPGYDERDFPNAREYRGAWPRKGS